MTTPAHLYTLEEVARHLGLSVRTIKRFVAAGKLQVLQFGRTMRVSEEEFARFLREGTEPHNAPARAADMPTKAPAELDRKIIYELARQTARAKRREPPK